MNHFNGIPFSRETERPSSFNNSIIRTGCLCVAAHNGVMKGCERSSFVQVVSFVSQNCSQSNNFFVFCMVGKDNPCWISASFFAF